MSKLFTKTRREAPKDEVSKNAKLLIRAGFVHKEMAGVYSYLPLGLRVLNKITDIIREEMNRIGGQEVFLSSLQDHDIWGKTGRWQDEAVDIWFKTKLKSGTEVGLAFTHEEPLTNLMRDHLKSYRDLPFYAYQFQTKFRNETRSKSGVMRGREFLMKDLYSFSRDIKSHEDFYERSKDAYLKIFKRVGVGEITHVTFASGGSFSKFSHEFQTVSKGGEDSIHVCEKCNQAVNDEIFKEVKTCPNCGGNNFTKKTAIEVGNIFNLGTRFSEALGLLFLDEDGVKKPPVMGSYGIGPGRLMGAIVEELSDERGIVWPKSIAPFSVHLIEIGGEKNKDVRKSADELCLELENRKIDVLYDDREVGAGEKFADADLIGVPLRVVVSEKSIAAGGVEVKLRGSESAKIYKTTDMEAILSNV